MITSPTKYERFEHGDVCPQCWQSIDLGKISPNPYQSRQNIEKLSQNVIQNIVKMG